MSVREIWAVFVGVAATSLVMSIALGHSLMVVVNSVVLGIDLYMFVTTPKIKECDHETR